MLVPFLYRLRQYGVPVGTQELLSLASALRQGLHDNSLDGLYHVAKALLIHHEGHLDAYDQAFVAEFRGVEGRSQKLKEELLKWLDDAEKRIDELTDQERQLLKSLNPEELRKLFEERMDEQKERHDKGNRWIGTQGESQFGRQGNKGGGMRIGSGNLAGQRSAIQSADARKYRPYRSDLTLDVRQMEMALKRLRAYVRQGAELELDLDGTIDATAKNAGELEVKLRPESRPNTRVILMMDVGGSMDPYAQLMSRLFSATRKATHWKELRTYYFHNCPYGRVYKTETFDEPLYITDLMHECGREYKLVIVGDALMGPYELMRQGGAMSATDRTALSGIGWLMHLREHFRHAVWLNPEPPSYWDGSTINQVRQVFDMYHLTLDGLSQAMTKLNQGSKR